jgi:hypothetical protein
MQRNRTVSFSHDGVFDASESAPQPSFCSHTPSSQTRHPPQFPIARIPVVLRHLAYWHRWSRRQCDFPERTKQRREMQVLNVAILEVCTKLLHVFLILGIHVLISVWIGQDWNSVTNAWEDYSAQETRNSLRSGMRPSDPPLALSPPLTSTSAQSASPITTGRRRSDRSKRHM